MFARMITILSTVFIGFFSFASVQQDLGFRYKDGACKNAKGETGYNKGYFGQCTDFRGTILGKLELEGVDFSGSSFENADLQAIKFIKCTFTGVDFSGANLSGTQFDNSTLSKTLFIGANLRKSAFLESEVSNIDFSKAEFSQSDLSYVVARNSKFNEAVLKDALLISADLTGASFAGANLVNAVLSDSVLVNVNFENAQLQRANLKTSNYKNGKWKSAKFTTKTILPFSIEEALKQGMLKLANCSVTDVEFEESCYYLDGSGGKCDSGYTMASEDILNKIAPLFAGKNYRHKVSTNCCIDHSESFKRGQNWGFDFADGCNQPGPFKGAPKLGGAGCTNAQNHDSQQLTLCKINE